MPRDFRLLPLPPHYNPGTVATVRRVPYQERALAAIQWAREHRIPPAKEDRFRINLIAIDIQNTFCIPDFELFVAGRSGSGAIDDNRRLCEFIYRNLAHITQITPTLDTHRAMQIFHPVFLVDEHGRHPKPYATITEEDVQSGRWRFNPVIADSLEIEADYGQSLLIHYTRELKAAGKYQLIVWPYHAILGGIGHALVAAVEEAIFFHTIARNSQPDLAIKGDNTFTEHYSALGPEILKGPQGESLGQKNAGFINKLNHFDALVIAGQAKSHCVAWTIADLLKDIQSLDATLAHKVYLLEDCTSPVVVPGVDFSEQAEAAFAGFAEAGMHLVRSTVPIAEWPGIESESPG